MTELEKIEYAKFFIDKLANGINPIDDKPATEQDIINNVRIARCFFYVSDILRQVIENGGITVCKKKVKDRFNLTQEKLSEFNYSKTPISVSEIAKKLNELIDKEQTKRITYRQITNWLLSVDALTERIYDNGKSKKYPTETGIKLGITVETRNGMNGEYQVVVYNTEAQMFIVDNIGAIISFDNK